MRNVAILTSVLAMLGTGNAAALDAAWSVGPSDANDQPVPRFQIATQVDRTTVTASVNSASGVYGFPARADGRAGFSAAQGFGPSDSNDQPVPRFQIAR